MDKDASVMCQKFSGRKMLSNKVVVPWMGKAKFTNIGDKDNDDEALYSTVIIIF